jgi:putative transposase
MYYWRKLNKEQRDRVIRYRLNRNLPWHRPPHLEFSGSLIFIITAACFEHHAIIGRAIERIAEFERSLIESCQANCESILAWCVLPNHYHILIQTDRLAELRKAIGRLHGRTSRKWNLEDNTIGRKVWYNYFDREMKSDRHYWASLNYVHNNAVHHGYVDKWQDWPFSSAREFLDDVGYDEATRIWKEYPVLDYGSGWDVY